MEVLKRTCFVFMSVWVILSVGIGALAEVPNQINYQGQLTDITGMPVPDGLYEITFSIYDGSNTQRWTEVQHNVQVTNGIFNVMLPSNHLSEPFPADLFNEDLFLGVQVGEDAEMTPLQPLTSAPFALKAEDANTLEGNSTTDLDARYVNENQVGAVTSAMIADNSIGAEDLGVDSVGAEEISTGAVGSKEVAAESLTAADLADNAVGASELADSSVDTDAIVTFAITGEKIYPNAVDSSKIADGSVTAGDLADGAAIAEILDDDGSDSGLNADLLDNHDATYFAASSHLHDSRYVNASGDTMSGSLTVENTLSVGTDAGDDNDSIYMDSGVGEWLRWENKMTRFQLSDALNVAGGTLAVGTHASQPAYNSIGSGTPESGGIVGATDLYVHDDFETGDDIHAGGDLSISGSLSIGIGDPTDNDWIYMDDGGEYLRWDDDLDNDPGNGLDGGFFFSDELEVSGSVGISGSSSEFRYKTPKTRYLNIPACAFVKDDFYTDTVWSFYTGFAYTADKGAEDSCTVYAPVYLPEGAEVTDVEVRYYDNHATRNVELAFSLMMSLNDIVSLYTMAEGSTTSSEQNSAIQTLADNDGVIGYNPISSDRSYYIAVDWNPTDITRSTNLRFYGATITYTVDRVGN